MSEKRSMIGWFPSRRVLGMPAWVWAALPISLLGPGALLWRVWLPPDLTEPADRADIFREIILVTRQGDGFRFVPYSESKGTNPLWAVGVTITGIARGHWDAPYFFPGFLQRESHWTYQLQALPFPPSGHNDSPLTLVEMAQLKPLVVAELNRRADHLGDRLEVLLANGLLASSYVCPQNAVILLGWLSVPMAVIGFISMIVRPRPTESARAALLGSTQKV
jgi:hypothetical protein